jgi:hypothetical protein
MTSLAYSTPGGKEEGKILPSSDKIAAHENRNSLLHWFINSLTYFFAVSLRGLYATTLITEMDVIPAKAGIQDNTGFRVKPGMTNYTGPIYGHV